ncbi:hypothetical protein VTN49DRAFT_6865 [Thermomyces lanuginosus]|uniref:uncharacterized protein n=1 Tax=Thermomyces lanuginosus TaxID=5541 RepID=UPI0037420002
MSYPQDSRSRRGPRPGMGFSSTGRRTLMGYWVPLAITVGVAAISIAAWIWSEREERDDDGEYDGRDRDHPEGRTPSEGASSHGVTYARSTAVDERAGTQSEDSSVIARMQGALRRTPSPQQIFDGASRRVAAGVAAAGALVGGALSSIREERGDFEDHSRWQEEADARARAAARSAPPEKKRKTVALVVSSATSHDGPEDLSLSEHASILSHLPSHVDPDVARIFVLIYAPGLSHTIGLQSSSSRPTPSVDSSFSQIGHEEALSASATGDNGPSSVEPQPSDDIEGTSPPFKTLYNQAQTLVDRETMIMPFSTPNGYVHILRHLSPDIVYVQESLTGQEGENVQQVLNWVRQVVVVIGDEGGRGGLVDSDDESAVGGKAERWWQKEGVTGIGKGIDVIDGLRIGEDWRRRVSGLD